MKTEENQYMSLKVDLGIFGEAFLMVVDNKKKDKPTDPDVRVLVRQADNNLKNCGAGWINTKKETSGTSWNQNTKYDKKAD